MHHRRIPGRPPVDRTRTHQDRPGAPAAAQPHKYPATVPGSVYGPQERSSGTRSHGWTASGIWSAGTGTRSHQDARIEPERTESAQDGPQALARINNQDGTRTQQRNGERTKKRTGSAGPKAKEKTGLRAGLNVFRKDQRAASGHACSNFPGKVLGRDRRI